MEALKETSIHHMALKILSDITTMNGYDEIIYKTVQVRKGESYLLRQ